MTLAMHRKGLYKDGHERRDVIEYRKQYCLDLLAARGDKDTVVVYHDECIVESNDGIKQSWILADGEGSGQKMYRKNRGPSLMISGFICKCHGRMIETEPDAVKRILKACSDNGIDKLENMYDIAKKRMDSFVTIQPGSGEGKRLLCAFFLLYLKITY